MSQRTAFQPSAILLILRHNTPTIAGLFVLVVLGVLYYKTRTVVHTFDAVSYMWNIEVKPLHELFHPHHLLYAPLGKLAYRLAQSLGYHGHADMPIQVVNAFAGTLGILFLWRFGVQWTRHAWASLGVSVMVGLCYSYWLYTAEVEVYTLATAFLTLSMWILMMLDEKPHPARAAALGLAHAGSMMFHQTNALFAIPVIAFLLLRPTLRKPNILAAYIGMGTLAVLVPYGWVIGQSGLNSWESIYFWLTDYAQTGRWGGYLSLEHLPALRAGLENSISTETWLSWIFYALVAIGIGAGVWQARRDPRRISWLIFGGTWLIPYMIFFWWWEPFNIEFWIALLPLWGFWMMAGWPVQSPITDETTKPTRLILETAYTIVPTILAIFLLNANLSPVKAAGDPHNDYYYLITTALQSELAPDDLIVTRGNILDVYVPFYTRHSGYLSLREVEYNNGGDRARILEELIARFDEALATGQTIWVDQMVLDEPRSAERNPFGLQPEDIVVLTTRYALQPDIIWNGTNVFYSTPHGFPSDVTSWSFVESLSGWRAVGIDAPHFDRAWCFSGGDDPQLQSMHVEIDAEQWSTLEINMEIDVAQSYLQFFWRTKQHDYSLDHSAQVDITHGRNTYVIQLEGLPGWAGAVTQLRLDPIPGISNTNDVPITVCLYSIRLITSR
ncbi:MAG: glycosyltransferase family 39 protein [Anaerolineae bacterium]|nr:glycosyltransferase family 39 protein [Anaerolineae bacterium]